jgi:toxin ParE1/3/4
VAQVELAPEVFDDIDRIFDHFEKYQDTNAGARIEEIMQAIDVLGVNPLIGRRMAGGKRELVIGRKPRGFLALYQFIEVIDTVFVLAVRSQREAGYER